MSESAHRTLVCSVLFLDIEGYTKRSVTDQLKLKQQFNDLLVAALRHVATDDRIILDTGDGAAVSFLADPEDSLFSAMSMRDAIAAVDLNQFPPLRVRIGINLGPVRLLKDINGQINIIGDGINDAQRVMSFAEPGKILVSRSYYEVISRLSSDYANLFTYDGTRTDKHVREHAVYAMEPSIPEPQHDCAANAVIAQSSVPASPVTKLNPNPNERPAAARARDTVRLGGRKWIAIATLAVLAIVGISTFWLWRGKSPETVSAPPSDKSVAMQAAQAGNTKFPEPSGKIATSGSVPAWLIEMRKELAVCRKQGFFARQMCTEKVRWKYCAPSHWNKFEECHAGGSYKKINP